MVTNYHPPGNSDSTFSMRRRIENVNDQNELDYLLNYTLGQFAVNKLPNQIGKGVFSLRIEQNIIPVDGGTYGGFEKMGDDSFKHNTQRDKEFELRIWMNEITFQEEPVFLLPFEPEVIEVLIPKPWDRVQLELNWMQRIILWIAEKLYDWSEKIVKDRGVGK